MSGVCVTYMYSSSSSIILYFTLYVPLHVQNSLTRKSNKAFLSLLVTWGGTAGRIPLQVWPISHVWVTSRYQPYWLRPLRTQTEDSFQEVSYIPGRSKRFMRWYKIMVWFVHVAVLILSFVGWWVVGHNFVKCCYVGTAWSKHQSIFRHASPH